MKNTKSRKRILLSSIAMLLVALVALGSATYAWFTLNKTVYADNMKVQVAAAKGLQVTGAQTDWGSKYTFSSTNEEGFNKQLNPASISVTGDTTKHVNANTIFAPEITADGRYSDHYGVTEGYNAKFESVTTVVPKTSGDSANSNGYATAYEVGVRSKDGSAIGTADATNPVTLAIAVKYTDAKVKDYVRVAVVDQGDATSTAYATQPVVGLFGNETGAKAISDTTPTPVNQTLTPLTYNSSNIATNTITVGQVTSAHYYTILVWFEGEDADCETEKAAGGIEITATFSVN